MNISFIVPATDKKKIKALKKNVEKWGEVVDIYGASSMFDAWKSGLERAKHNTIVLTHQDVDFLEIPDFDFSIYQLQGVAGTTVLHKDQPWWFSKERLFGNLLSGRIYHKYKDGNKLMGYGDLGEVVCLDGVCLATTKEYVLNVGIPKIDWASWDFYDHILSLEYIKKGYRLTTIPIIMVHESTGGGQERFNKDMEKFKKEYLQEKTWRLQIN